MSKSDSITRHHLIIKKLRKRPMSFLDLEHYLETETELQDYKFTVSLRTFQRDIQDIRKIYGIDIKYDRAEKIYAIDEGSEILKNDRIFEAYDTFNALSLTDKLSEHIYFEQRRPKGTENIHGLLHAIKKQVQINFIYYNFLTKSSSVKQIEPYALKEFRNRWYVIGFDFEKNDLHSFGLDRLSELEITSVKNYKFDKVDIEKRYRHCFGIVAPNADEPEEIILSFLPHQGEYIKSLPLHYSQEVLIDDGVEFRIKLKLYITFDLEIELRSFGHNMKVIKPESLINKIKKSFRLALESYE